jgi:hypothetical protein
LIADTFVDPIERGRDRLPTTRKIARMHQGRVVGLFDVPFYSELEDIVEHFIVRGRNLYRAWTSSELPR